MLALREECIHPTSNKAYVLESSGGKDCSPEGHQVSSHHAGGLCLPNSVGDLEDVLTQELGRTYSWVRGEVCK